MTSVTSSLSYGKVYSYYRYIVILSYFIWSCYCRGKCFFLVEGYELDLIGLYTFDSFFRFLGFGCVFGVINSGLQ